MSVTRTEGARLPAYATARRLPSRATENAATSAPVTPGTRRRRTWLPRTTSTRAPSRGPVDQPQVAEHVVRRPQDVGAADDRPRRPAWRRCRPRPEPRTPSSRCRRRRPSAAATRSPRGCASSSRDGPAARWSPCPWRWPRSTTRPPRSPHSVGVGRAGGVELGAAGDRRVDPATGERHGRAADGDPHALDAGHLAQRPRELVDGAAQLAGRRSAARRGVSGTSATPLSVTTTDRSRSVREGSADRLTSRERRARSGEQAADQVGGRLLAARDEHRVGQQHPTGLVVEVEVEPGEAARSKNEVAHDQRVDRVVDAPLAVLGDEVEAQVSSTVRAACSASHPARRDGGCRPAGPRRRRWSASRCRRRR